MKWTWMSFWTLLFAAIKRCVDDIKALGYDPKDVRAVMGDGIICGIAGVNEEGDAITPYINYLDTRTDDDVRFINDLNLDIWVKETGNPEACTMFPAMFARWFLKNNTKFQQQGVKFMHNAPYILSHLAGLKGKDAFIDWGAMSGWGLGYNVTEERMVQGTAGHSRHQRKIHAAYSEALGHYRRPQPRQCLKRPACPKVRRFVPAPATRCSP
ncbi:MAG: hypothetical protein ACLSE8_02990 [Parasutterella sp.]